MKFNIKFEHATFNVDLRKNDLYGDTATALNYCQQDYITCIDLLRQHKREVNPGSDPKGININYYNGLWNINNMACASYKTAYAAVLEAIKGPEFSVNKLYRFSYDGGTRSGEKRASKVVEIHDTYIDVEDLNDGTPRRYTLSKISQIEKIG